MRAASSVESLNVPVTSTPSRVMSPACSVIALKAPVIAAPRPVDDAVPEPEEHVLDLPANLRDQVQAAPRVGGTTKFVPCTTSTGPVQASMVTDAK